MDGFVHTKHDASFCRLFRDPPVVADHVLPVVPFELHISVIVAPLDALPVTHITRLDIAHTMSDIEIEGLLQLRFVVQNGRTGLMMPDQFHLPVPRIARHFRHVELRMRLREIEDLTVGDPIAVPAGVPPFHQHPVESMLGRKIDHPLGARCGRAVGRPGAPGSRAEMHLPPDARVFRRPDPARVGDAAGFVEVQCQRAFEQLGRVLGHLNHAPWRTHRQRSAHPHTVGPRHQIGLQATLLGPPQGHAGEIGQRGLV